MNRSERVALPSSASIFASIRGTTSALRLTKSSENLSPSFSGKCCSKTDLANSTCSGSDICKMPLTDSASLAVWAAHTCNSEAAQTTASGIHRERELNKDRLVGISSHPIEDRRQVGKKTARSCWWIVERQVPRPIRSGTQDQARGEAERVDVYSSRVCPRIVGLCSG